MRHRAIAATLAATIATLVLASSALAGGWANAILDDPGAGGPPSAGEPVTIGFTLLQHGVTPVNWGSPTMTITNTVTGEERTFEARQVGASGHWVVAVTYPTNGTWRTTVRHPDLEVGMQGFGPVTIGPAGAAPAAPAAPPATVTATTASMNPLRTIATVVFAIALLAALLLAIVGLRRRRGVPRRVSA
jgi:hypothetical protein